MTMKLWHSERGHYIYLMTRACTWILHYPRLVRFHEGWENALPLVERAYLEIYTYENQRDFETTRMKYQPPCILDPDYEREEEDMMICYTDRHPMVALYDNDGVWMRDEKLFRPTLLLWDGNIVYRLDYKVIRRKKRFKKAIVIDGTWVDLFRHDILNRQHQGVWGKLHRKRMREQMRALRPPKQTLNKQERMRRAIEEAAATDIEPAPDLSPAARAATQPEKTFKK